VVVAIVVVGGAVVVVDAMVVEGGSLVVGAWVVEVVASEVVVVEEGSVTVDVTGTALRSQLPEREATTRRRISSLDPSIPALAAGAPKVRPATRGVLGEDVAFRPRRIRGESSV
jgi:hypothetical protein